MFEQRTQLKHIPRHTQSLMYELDIEMKLKFFTLHHHLILLFVTTHFSVCKIYDEGIFNILSVSFTFAISSLLYLYNLSLYMYNKLFGVHYIYFMALFISVPIIFISVDER